MELKCIFLRGLTRGNGHWGDFPEVLRRRIPGLDLELMEIPGNGTQNDRRTPTDPFEVIDDLRSRSRLARAGEEFHICGISLGGSLAMKWAEADPIAIQSVAVINAGLDGLSSFHHRLLPANYFFLLGTLFLRQARAREERVLSVTSNHPGRAQAWLPELAEFSRRHPCTRANFFRQLRLARAVRVQAPLPVPLKVIFSPSDRLVNPICSAAIARAFDAEVASHPTAGHDLPLDDPEWLAEELRKWWARGGSNT